MVIMLYLFLTVFVFQMVVVATNVLNGLAISDVEKIEKDFEIINFQSRLESLIHIESILLQNCFGKFFQEIFECFGVNVLFFKIDQVISFGDTSFLNGFEYTFNPNFTDMDSDIIFETKKLLFTKEVGNEKLATGSQSHTTN